MPKEKFHSVAVIEPRMPLQAHFCTQRREQRSTDLKDRVICHVASQWHPSWCPLPNQLIVDSGLAKGNLVTVNFHHDLVIEGCLCRVHLVPDLCSLNLKALHSVGASSNHQACSSWIFAFTFLPYKSASIEELRNPQLGVHVHDLSLSLALFTHALLVHLAKCWQQVQAHGEDMGFGVLPVGSVLCETLAWNPHFAGCCSKAAVDATLHCSFSNGRGPILMRQLNGLAAESMFDCWLPCHAVHCCRALPFLFGMPSGRVPQRIECQLARQGAQKRIWSWPLKATHCLHTLLELERILWTHPGRVKLEVPKMSAHGM